MLAGELFRASLGINSSKSFALAGIQLTELRYVISLEGMTLVA